MKLVKFLRIFFYYLRDRFFFNIKTLSMLLHIINKNSSFSWQISNFAESYWYLYSNKKSIFESRYLL